MGRELKPGVDKIPESWVKERVKRILSRFDSILVDMPPASMYGNAGRHDFIICQNGQFWTIETKAGYNLPSDLQKSFAYSVIKAKGYSYIINEFNYWRVLDIVRVFDVLSTPPPSDDFRNYKGGKEYASKTWGTCFSS